MYKLFMNFSQVLLPVFILIIFIHAFIKRVPVYDVFVEGASEGFWLAVKLIPYVLGIYVAVEMFQHSGAMDIVISVLKPFLTVTGVPGELVPLLIVRPLSGPAALGMTADILEKYGPDSFIGRLASTIDGSTDTTIYIIAVYFASVGVKKPRYALPVGLLADMAGFGAAVFICHRVFG